MSNPIIRALIPAWQYITCWIMGQPEVQVLRALKEVWTNTQLWTPTYTFMSTLYSRSAQLHLWLIWISAKLLLFLISKWCLQPDIFFLLYQLSQRSPLCPAGMVLVKLSCALLLGEHLLAPGLKMSYNKLLRGTLAFSRQRAWAAHQSCSSTCLPFISLPLNQSLFI